MKPVIKKNGPLLLALFAVVLTIGLVSWGQKQTDGHYQQSQNDTTPKKNKSDRDKKIRDLDDVLDELNDAEINVDMEKIRQEIAEAMKKIDGDKIRMEIEKAMKEVDMAKIQKEVQESLAKVDFEKIKTEIAEAMKEVDMTKIQKEVQESLAKIDWDKMKLEIDKIRDIDMKKFEAEMKKLGDEMKELGPEMEKELGKARQEIEKAKVQIKEFKSFTDDLEKDGLINKKEGYTLKHKDGELFINGKKVSEQVYNKYRNFLEKNKKFSIDKTDDDFDMDLD